MKSLLLPCAMAIAMLLVPTIAAAQEAPSPAPASAPAAMPDIVVLKDGSMLRGTIVELDKQKEVTIQLPTGKTRTIAMSEVTYAGAEADRPKAEAPKPQPVQSSPQGGTADGTARPFVTVQGKPAMLQLTANIPEATFHLKTSTAVVVAGGRSGVGVGYEVICTAPCTATLPTGTHQLAVSRRDGIPTSDTLVPVAGDSLVLAKHVSNAGYRIAALVVAGAGLVGGAALAFKEEEDPTSMTNMYAGLGVIVLGCVIGSVIYRQDKFELSIAPATVKPSNARIESRSLVPDGVALTGRF